MPNMDYHSLISRIQHQYCVTLQSYLTHINVLGTRLLDRPPLPLPALVFFHISFLPQLSVVASCHLPLFISLIILFIFIFILILYGQVYYWGFPVSIPLYLKDRTRLLSPFFFLFFSSQVYVSLLDPSILYAFYLHSGIYEVALHSTEYFPTYL